MPLYIFARFDPLPGKQAPLLEELTRVVQPTREEPGCLEIQVYESYDRSAYFIHSKWTDEEAFEAHADLPHTTRFLAVIKHLISNPFQAVRTRIVEAAKDSSG
jgi:quinol monooxygenase YgiN